MRRGAKEHPGAVAVEDERGRVVSLARLPPTRRDALAKCDDPVHSLCAAASLASGTAGEAGLSIARTPISTASSDDWDVHFV